MHKRFPVKLTTLITWCAFHGLLLRLDRGRVEVETLPGSCQYRDITNYSYEQVVILFKDGV